MKLLSYSKNTASITFVTAILATAVCSAQVIIPQGTKVRVRLESTISSATAEEGQTVELRVAEPVRIGEVTVIAEGAHVTGTTTEAHEKRLMGRAGKLDFSIDRVKAVDDRWVPLRYTVTKKSGQSHAVRTGVITAGVAFAFWPAAPVMLLMRGKDITIHQGVSFDVYTDVNQELAGGATPKATAAVFQAAPASLIPPDTATVSIVSSTPGADIEVDGSFVGNTPTTVRLNSGLHRILVKANDKVWSRSLEVNAGSTISLDARFSEAAN